MAAMSLYKKRFPLMAVLITSLLFLVVRFLIFYQAAAATKIVLDLVIIGFAALVCYNILGMIRELNYIVAGVLILTVGQMTQDWPLYLVGSASPEIMSLSILIRYVFNFAGFGLMFYGLVKFYEKYKFD